MITIDLLIFTLHCSPLGYSRLEYLTYHLKLQRSLTTGSCCEFLCQWRLSCLDQLHHVVQLFVGCVLLYAKQARADPSGLCVFSSKVLGVNLHLVLFRRDCLLQDRCSRNDYIIHVFGARNRICNGNSSEFKRESVFVQKDFLLTFPEICLCNGN